MVVLPFYDDFFVVVVASAVNRMHDAVGSTLNATAKGVVAAFVVVVAHVVFLFLVDLFLCFDVDVFSGCSPFVLDVVGSTFATLVV